MTRARSSGTNHWTWGGDVRTGRLLQELAFPSGKEGMKPRSLAYLRLVLADKRRSAVLATFPRSGQHWTADVLGYAVVKHHRGAAFRLTDGPGSFRERLVDPVRLLCAADSRSRHEPRLRTQLPGLDLDWFFHTHQPWPESALWGLDAARHVLVSRNLPATLYSCFLNRRRIESYAGFEDFLERSPYLALAVRFYNAWHAYGQGRAAQLRIFRYEELRREPAANFAAMYEWVFREDVPAGLIAEAVAQFSLERMKAGDRQRPPDPTRPGYHRGAESYREEMSEAAWRHIAETLARQLTCDWPGLQE